MNKLDELYEIAKAEGVTIDEFNLPELKAVIVRTKTGCHIGLDSKYAAIPHLKRELLAHELGHCVRNAVYTNDSLYPMGKLEHQASSWAIEELVPRDELIKAYVSCGIDGTEYDIAERFGVSVEFLREAVEYYKNSAPMR